MSCDPEDKLNQVVDFLLVAFSTHEFLFNWMLEHYGMTKGSEKKAIEKILNLLENQNKAKIHKLIRRNGDVEYLLYHIMEGYEIMFLDGLGPNPDWIQMEAVD
jgi:hypothetical protein